jgi:dienelactone hydrolase
LPAPTGPYAVGTTSWNVVDAHRLETFATTRRPRDVQVLAWYPANASPSSGPPRRAPYLRESIVEARAFATLLRAPGAYDSLAVVETDASLDADVVSGTTPLPLLVFSPGFTGLASASTALIEDLASHGYVVLDIVHPYEVVAATLSDGSVVTMLDSTGGPRTELRRIFTEWADEDSTMARVTRATSDAARLTLLRAYFAGLTATREALDRWVADTRLVLDDLAAQSRSTLAGRLATRVDTRRVGVFGHSMGGVVAGQFCSVDTRCVAGLNLDGIPQSGTMIDAKNAPPFLMVYSGRPARLGANDAIYSRASTRYCRVDVPGTLHLDFSDMNAWGGPLRARGAFGSIAPDRAADVTRNIVRGYFDEQLRGTRSTNPCRRTAAKERG